MTGKHTEAPERMIQMIDNLEFTVHEALDNAVINGYPPQDLTVQQNAQQLVMLCPSLEEYAPGHIERYVQTWLNKNLAHTTPSQSPTEQG